MRQLDVSFLQVAYDNADLVTGMIFCPSCWDDYYPDQAKLSESALRKKHKQWSEGKSWYCLRIITGDMLTWGAIRQLEGIRVTIHCMHCEQVLYVPELLDREEDV